MDIVYSGNDVAVSLDLDVTAELAAITQDVKDGKVTEADGARAMDQIVCAKVVEAAQKHSRELDSSDAAIDDEIAAKQAEVSALQAKKGSLATPVAVIQK